MVNTFGFLRSQSEGGFQFAVLDACKAEGIDLNQTCSLNFGPNHELQSIGNITRGNFTPQPGIAGQGIWLGLLYLFGLILVAFFFVFVELISRFEPTRKWASNGKYVIFQIGVLEVIYYFKDPPDDGISAPGRNKKWSAMFRACIRAFVLGTSDSQTILVGAFILSFAGQSKCQLTSYHFTVAVDLMTIYLSVIVFSVALVRTYWRNPFTAGFRVLLSAGAFVGVGLTIFRRNNYSPEWPPPSGRNDSAILLPVACLLETNLWLRAENQTKQHGAELGFQGSPSQWPIERFFYILLVFAFLVAHASIGVRRLEGRHGEGNPTRRAWGKLRGKLTVAYWLIVLLIPTVASLWCWIQILKAREWVAASGWIGEPNLEFNIWDSGQLIPLGGVILILIIVLTELKSREEEAGKRKNGASWSRIAERDYLQDPRRQEARLETHSPVNIPLANLRR